jgi:hypothetical protein
MGQFHGWGNYLLGSSNRHSNNKDSHSHSQDNNNPCSSKLGTSNTDSNQDSHSQGNNNLDSSNPDNSNPDSSNMDNNSKGRSRWRYHSKEVDPSKGTRSIRVGDNLNGMVSSRLGMHNSQGHPR